MSLLEKFLKRGFIELSTGGIILLLIYLFQDSKNLVLVLMLIYIAILFIIYGVRKLT